jgi:hypothetical protein
MNAAHQALSGLPTDAFPSDVPVFMGHYHLPQVRLRHACAWSVVMRVRMECVVMRA